jgi:hypothetical protein
MQIRPIWIKLVLAKTKQAKAKQHQPTNLRTQKIEE